MFSTAQCFVLALLLNVAAAVEPIGLMNKNFQLQFLQSIADLADQQAALSLNGYLQQLAQMKVYANYSQEMAEAQREHLLHAKALLIKQLLDVAPSSSMQEDLEHTTVLRNLVFLGKLKRQIREMHEASGLEIRQMRLHRLCKQFDRRESPQVTKRQAGGGLLINEQTVGAALEQLNLTQSLPNVTLELNQFGHDLYERVKINGAHIIDNYLEILRELLKNIMEEQQPEFAQSSSQLNKLLQELDSIMKINDFYDKRQRLYGYLERHLAADYEQLRQNSADEHNLTELFEQLKTKGLDLFVIFLFSNFEFLEHVHEHWAQLLPQTHSLLYDDNARELYDIQQLYNNFKLDTESMPKYDAYVAALRRLHERTVEQGQQNRHIFELLNNAAQNVGSVTFNMIKAKCKELL